MKNKPTPVGSLTAVHGSVSSDDLSPSDQSPSQPPPPPSEPITPPPQLPEPPPPEPPAPRPGPEDGQFEKRSVTFMEEPKKASEKKSSKKGGKKEKGKDKGKKKSKEKSSGGLAPMPNEESLPDHMRLPEPVGPPPKTITEQAEEIL